MEKNKELTRAEMQVMKILWDIKQGFLNEIIEKYEEPKPAYTTISTFVRILVKKGFIGFEVFGKSFRYFPLISKEEYTEIFMSSVKNNLFNGSISRMFSYFMKKEQLSTKEINALIQMLDESNAN